MKARELLAVLAHPPMRYRVVRQTGSHRRLKSAAGYPPLTFAWHDGATLDEVRELAHSGAEFYLERPVEVEDRLPRYTARPTGLPDPVVVPA